MATAINLYLDPNQTWTAPANCTVVVYSPVNNSGADFSAGAIFGKAIEYSTGDVNPIALPAGSQIKAFDTVYVTGWTV